MPATATKSKTEYDGFGQPILEGPPVDEFGQPKEERAFEYQQRLRRNEAKVTEWAGETTEARSQRNADRNFQGPKRFRVSIPKDRVQPTLEINAHSEIEAQGRYDQLCGITQSDHPHEVVLVHGRPASAPQ